MNASPVGSDLTAESPLLNQPSSAGCLELIVIKGGLKSVMVDLPSNRTPETDLNK